MRKSLSAFLMTAVSAFCLTAADVSGPRAQERETDAVADARRERQFVGAVKGSSLGVVDDSGATDNTAALNALPVDRPIIGDCPHGGVVQFNGTWVWRSGLTVWQQSDCHLKSTITTLNEYPITIPGGAGAPSPISNVQYYGMNFGFITPTSEVRVMLVWINHFEFKHFTIDGSGGFAYIRGSDQEIAYGLLKTYRSLHRQVCEPMSGSTTTIFRPATLHSRRANPDRIPEAGPIVRARMASCTRTTFLDRRIFDRLLVFFRAEGGNEKCSALFSCLEFCSRFLERDSRSVRLSQ
jgi:hypothetical protein